MHNSGGSDNNNSNTSTDVPRLHVGVYLRPQASGQEFIISINIVSLVSFNIAGFVKH